MALRRMFSQEVVESGRFLSLPHQVQCLYFHLSMDADDDGFVSRPLQIAGMIGCGAADLKLLADTGLLLQLEDNLYVITDWQINNAIRKDRYRATRYSEEKARLQTGDSGSYEWKPEEEPVDNHDGNHLVTDPATQDRIGKGRLGKVRRERGCARTPAGRKHYGQYGWIRLTEEEHQTLVKELGDAEVERCIRYVDECAQATGNKNQWSDWSLVLRRCSRDRWGTGKASSRPAAVRDYGGDESFA